MQKILRVNTKTGEINEALMAEKYRIHGKRGLVDRFLLDEVDPKCDAMGPDNKLLICTGTFAGTPLPISGRVSVGGKSPLTGTIKESSVGGMLGPLMGSKKIKALVMERASKKAAFDYIDKPRFDAARMKFVDICKNNPRIQAFRECGSTNMMNVTGPLGIVPRRNFSGLPLTEEQKTHFTSQNWKAAGTKAGGRTGVPCHPGCIAMCSNVYH